MRGKRRLIAALVVAALCAPTVWLRSEIVRENPTSIELQQIAGESDIDAAGWRVAGVWEYTTAPNLRFGGYSALLALSSGRLRAYSDRGFLLTITEPDQPLERPEDRSVSRMHFAEPEHYWMLWDIESATRDPETGSFWLGFENTHAIHRFSARSEPEELRMLGGEVDWYDNGGLEAMERLSDGRFLAVPEGRSEALIYPADPVEGGAPEEIAFANPASDHAVTDIAQLPDGRLLLLLRDVAWGIPPFTGKLAIANAPKSGMTGEWSAEILFDLDAVIPPENYEGIAVRANGDGTIAVWIMSDDNFSVLQRTLLAKLVFDPSIEAQ
ncbi:hypothetical protein NAP1_13333 [Erythrobacter sp. NAP1]|uniref:esterase-like activity of phytase family protein n=1 Tax=Erythrobacter sp. NAP1 TaxID=237727 RepID=UPI0000687750|nr:esterase-like activity of phytase family protein [Erythrobacter sp. NAP1]EAQ28584.1 hypothetical protein NAP1_13333 [Erythrobacter sp. NAP1]